MLALFSVLFADCGSRSLVKPKDVEASALQSEVRDPQARAFYEMRQWQAAWDAKSEKALLAIIEQSPANGLNPDLFVKPPLPQDPNAREAALTSVALRYASALARGYADPTKIRGVYTVPRPRTNVAAGLQRALETGDLDAWYATLPPQTDEYRALSDAHIRYLQQAAKVRLQPISAGKPIKPGRRDPRLTAVIAALTATGYLPAEPSAPPAQRYSRPLVAAVKKLQADFGMKPDGVIGEGTLEVLNLGPAGRARQLAIAMERLRWLEREPPARRIDVNTAAAFLEYYRGDRVVDRRTVVVGEPDWETPQLGSALFQLVANPLWRVPDSIVQDELSKKSPAYLANNGFEWRDGRLVQASGEKNSLGIVKFDLKNDQHIYLHDTPFKALFGLPERHRSHGCVRVHNALQFAAMLASESAVLDDFEDGLSSGEETYVKLNQEIPVRLLYHTAFWDGSHIQFRPDVYGWDDDVALALGLVRGAPRKAYQRTAEDVGP
jgi:L,D-transpeptidase YcbB